ncbi:D-ribose pyranase [Bariatricus massiliensis]|uniref:D-ribose pyranase n=1 Tax=Bariatricus massiliensis TaxID=1745713 RepID=A0ABS8DHA1_9FIRM|nr:D-ribose pyranase [Bariatricus massiliensis]MCB7304802.1 D-ribose pyranase [Bariatricus massiliensis]MCB7375356.1 D-ribose pyranase [Bariatricus massiliensis]MCB7387816.1 D-ribose pyranase [Bariatricus massiliensis]MCB7412095.1 D-ribose pyranase [Bariatricus massiliensis]MCQ5254524.1 D-ribose pyranase [Bariatricus massiliensis]
MKKSGVLNANLMYELTKLRHLDKLVICDAGFPIPKGATVVDVSLVAGIPTFMQTLKAVLNEMIFEEYIIFDFMKVHNKEYYDEVKEIFVNQKSSEISMEDFIEVSKEAKLFIRTGELKPASNILLTSATGVREMNETLNISFDVV